MLEQLRQDDTVVVWKLDRLARSTRDLLETVETIREAGAAFRSLSEPWADTTSHGWRFIMTVFAGIAEFERDLIRERTHAGREVAKRRGVRFGRPPMMHVEQKDLAARLLPNSHPALGHHALVGRSDLGRGPRPPWGGDATPMVGPGHCAHDARPVSPVLARYRAGSAPEPEFVQFPRETFELLLNGLPSAA
jgi:hypothetical protein